MSKSDLRIEVLGTELSISTDEPKEYLETLLNKYRNTIENVQRLTGLKDPLKTAILTGFLLCDDLEKAGLQNKGQPQSEEAEELTRRMISRLDEIMYSPGDLSENTE